MDDLDILHPDAEMVVGGETIMVRALTFGQQLRLGRELRGLTDAIKAAHDEDRGVIGFMDAFSENGEGILKLLEAATGKPGDWIESLDDKQGEDLLALFWSVNQDFFVRRLAVYPALEKAARASMPSAGAASSPPSSGTATANPN
ncbi:MAG: hypothetical protein FWC58_03770 [Desulfobulbus sp.]|nr:hypothetical protein [Desulfobulbus sp.]